MSYQGEWGLGATVKFLFNTVSLRGQVSALTSGTAIAYVDCNTTQVTAGITITDNFDSQGSGLLLCSVDTSQSGYTAGSHVDIVLTVGTVEGDSVVALKIGCFKLTAAESVAGYQPVDVVKWTGGAIPGVNVTGVPLVDLKYTLGTISPATAGSVRADSVTGAVGSVTGLTASNLDTTISSRASASAMTALTAIFSGITSLAQWLGLLAGKQTGNSTARTEIRATGAGSGAFDETTDSQEALRDRGDAAWITATGFSTLDAAGVRTAVGLASANLDTQLGQVTLADASLTPAKYSSGMLPKSTINDAGASTTSFVTALSSAVDDFYVDAAIAFTTGALAGQARRISAYNGTTKAITVSEAFTSAPANGVSFMILGRLTND